MPNRRLAPRVAATKARRRRRRGKRWDIRGSWLLIKFAWLVKHFRGRRSRSSPSIRQILLAVLSAGVGVLVIRAVTRRVNSRGADAPAGAHDEPQEVAATEPTTGNDTVASESALTDRVQSEMFRRSNAPAPSTGSG